MTIKKYKYIYIYIWIHLFKMILFFLNNNNKDWRPSDEGRPIFEKKAVSMNQTSAARLSVICRPLWHQFRQVPALKTLSTWLAFAIDTESIMYCTYYMSTPSSRTKPMRTQPPLGQLQIRFDREATRENVDRWTNTTTTHYVSSAKGLLTSIGIRSIGENRRNMYNPSRQKWNGRPYKRKGNPIESIKTNKNV